MRKQKNNAAFTLIELLVTTVIAAVISVALFTAFSNGIRLWRRVNTRIAGEQLVLFCERLHADLRSCFSFSAIACTGSARDLTFASLISVPGEPLKTIGRVSYSFNGDAVIRTTDDYSQVYTGRTGAGRVVATGLKSVTLEYYSYDSLKKEFRWLPEWAQEGLPFAVRVSATFQDGRAFTRTFTLPAGGTP